MNPADFILYNGHIYTMATPNAAPQQALAVQGERIVAVGDNDGIWSWKGPRTARIDLRGQAVLPGLIDAHVHFGGYARRLRQINLAGAQSLADMVGAIAVRAAETPAGQWLLGGGWNHNPWDLGRFPCRQDVDGVAGDHPLVLRSKDGHVALVNTAALRLAGIDAATPDPAGGEIERDSETGEPTGILKENALGLISEVIPETSEAELATLLKRAFVHAHQWGLTGVHDHEGATELALFQRLAARGQLGLRICASIPSDRLDEALALGICSGLGDRWLRIGGLKIFSDGALGARTADMLSPYEGEESDRGIEVTEQAALTELVVKAARGGIYSCIHAIGDRANRKSLNAFAAAQEASHLPLRHRIEHVQLLHPDDIPRLAPLGVIASMQPVHCTSDIDIADRHWGARARYAYAWRSLLAAGAALAFGSDAPVESMNPWYGLYAAVTRQRPDGTPAGGWYPQERLSLGEAVYGFTMGAAYASGEETLKGSLEPGKLADLIVLTEDVFEREPEALLETPVSMTMLGGQIVYER